MLHKLAAVQVTIPPFKSTRHRLGANTRTSCSFSCFTSAKILRKEIIGELGSTVQVCTLVLPFRSEAKRSEAKRREAGRNEGQHR